MEIKGSEVFCNICNKPIEKITKYSDVINQRIIYTVYCHGSSEETKLPMTTIKSAKEIVIGMAFKEKLLNK